MENGFFNGATEVVKLLTEIGARSARAADANMQAVREIDGVTYVWENEDKCWTPVVPPVPQDELHPDELRFYTLDGLIDYIKENTEGLIPSAGSEDRLILQVVDWKNVALLSQPSKNRKVRYTIARVLAQVPKIDFDYHMDNETFCTMLLSKFIDTPARADLFKVVKSLTNEQSLNTADDGVSQVVTVKQGVSLAANVKFENPVPLKPMRTFTEIDQPESNFTLRVDEKARPALFEADGGAWKNEAVALIKEYLKNNLYGCNVVVLA